MDAVIKKVGVVTEKQCKCFWSKVDKSGNCWIWKGSATTGSYGIKMFQKQTWLAHRLAWFLTYGKQTTKFLLHSCDNRLCVNPSHLREGDHIENAQDRMDRDRSAIGENHGRSVLTESHVPIIEKLRNEEGWGKKKIAKLLGVSTSTISYVLNGRNWKQVPRLYPMEKDTTARTTVYFNSRIKKFHCLVKVGNKTRFSAYFPTMEEAENAKKLFFCQNRNPDLTVYQ